MLLVGLRSVNLLDMLGPLPLLDWQVANMFSSELISALLTRSALKYKVIVQVVSLRHQLSLKEVGWLLLA